MVVATEDDTDVEVQYAYVGSDTLPNEHFTINKHEVFTRNTYFIDGQPRLDFTGSRVLADKPVAVFSGGMVYFADAVGIYITHINHVTNIELHK